jgi:hypothetical protein
MVKQRIPTCIDLALLTVAVPACGTVTGAAVGAGAGAAVGAGTGVGAAPGAIYDFTKK